MLEKISLYLYLILLIVLGGGGLASAQTTAPGRDNALWLTLAPPPAGKAPACEMHGDPDVVLVSAATSQKVRPGSNVAGQKSRGQGQPRAKSDFESEHRLTLFRTYFLQGATLSATARAYLVQPDGNHVELELTRAPQAKVSFKMPMTDDKRHGPNNVYVVDQEVTNGELIVRTAKWITIHHSCRWGHDYRNDGDRLKARTLGDIPLDIVIEDLWDGNFHVSTSSGDELKVHTLTYGKPLSGARVTLSTEKKWSHTETSGADGIAKIQLIRDYYPQGWSTFKRTQLGHLTLKAQYEVEESGIYHDTPYSRVRYITTMPWRYTPASADYASYAFGLGICFATLLASGLGIYYFRERRRKPYKGIRFDE